jgi:cytoskeletal protein RodZ
METRQILLLVGLLVANAAFADAYVWTDEDGVIHYSDRPHPGAKRVDLGESKPSSRSTTSRQTTAGTTTPPEESDVEEASPFRYDSLEVAAPAAEETLWNIAGELSVSLALSPALKPGHTVRVYFDGVAQTVPGTRFQLQEVYRGVHNLQAEVLDETGQLMIRSVPNRFYVQQSTVKFR